MNNKVHLLHVVTPSRLGEVPVLLNSQKQTQRVKQNEGTEECIPNERTRQNPRKRPIKMEIQRTDWWLPEEKVTRGRGWAKLVK